MAGGTQNGLRNVVEDLTPQLGGDLDVNGQSIVTTANGNLVLAPDGTGGVNVDLAGAANSRANSVTITGNAGAAGGGGVPLLFIDQLTSNSNAGLIDVHVDGASIFRVDNDGDMTVGQSITFGTASMLADGTDVRFNSNASRGFSFGTFSTTLDRGKATFGQDGNVFVEETIVSNENFDYVSIKRDMDATSTYTVDGYLLRLNDDVTNSAGGTRGFAVWDVAGTDKGFIDASGNINLVDNIQTIYGAGGPYTIEYDGVGGNALHTVTSGDFVFTGGMLGVGIAPSSTLTVAGDTRMTKSGGPSIVLDRSDSVVAAGSLAFRGSDFAIDAQFAYNNLAGSGLELNVSDGTLTNVVFIDSATLTTKIGDPTTNHAAISATGVQTFVGTAGLVTGTMFIPGVEIIVPIAAATPVELNDGTATFDGWSAGELSGGVTFPTGGQEHFLTVPTPGKYEVIWSISAHTASGGATTVNAGVMVDDVAQRNCGETERTVSTLNDTGSMGSPCVVDCPNGTEEISLWVSVASSTDLHVVQGTVTIKLIAGT